MSTDLQHSGPSPDLWRTIFRWHFYAGVFVMPVLLTLAVTGLGILIKPTLERTFYNDRLYVDSAISAKPMADQIAAVQSKYPGSTVRAVTPPPHDERSTQIDITAAGQSDLSVYVDPSSGMVLGAIENTHRLNNVLEKIHGTLWAGTAGDYFIELVAGWLLVLLASGLYLWWPRKLPRLQHAFPMRLRTPGRRRLRDLHATPASIVSIVLLFIVLTGLPWSGFWGENWARLADSIGAGNNTPDTPVSQVAAGSLETQGFQVAWANDRRDVPLSPTFVHTDEDTSSSSDDHYHVTPDKGPRVTPTTLSLERVAQIGNDMGMKPGFAIALPEDETGVYALSNSWPSKANAERTVFVDQYSNNVLTDHGWQQYGPLAKATSFGIAGHMGREFGPINAIVMALTCFAVIGAVLTAPLMWWKRRQSGSLSFPKRSRSLRQAKWIAVLAIVLGIIFPLLGLSMIVVALLDRFVVPRIPKLHAALGG